MTAAALAFAPFGVIFGQNYGGEASLRVILFSSAGCAILAAWGIETLRRGALRLAVSVVLALLMAGLFVPAFFGEAELNVIPSGEVAASSYFYAHAPAGSVLMLSAPGFPIRYGATYENYRGPQGDDDPNLLNTDTLRHKALGPQDVATVVSIIRQYSRSGFLVFSTTENEYASVFRLTPPNALVDLEQAVASSPYFHLWYATRDARIYQGVTP